MSGNAVKISSESGIFSPPRELCNMSLCPECDTPLRVSEDLEIGMVVLCPDCQIPLAVLHREPVELTLVPELAEGDWAD